MLPGIDLPHHISLERARYSLRVLKSDKKIEMALEAFLIIATLIGVLAMVSTVQKADHGTNEMPASADSISN